MPKRLQFSIRAILVAILLASLPLAWLAARKQAYLRRFARLNAFRELGGTVDAHFLQPGELIPGDGFSDDPACYFIALHLANSRITDRQMALIEPLTTLKTIDLRGTCVTDAGLKQLRRLAQLEQLNLEGTRVTDVGVTELRKCLPRCSIIK
ncbi:MAG TPA: hypothetical protein VF306_23380 [Pirellulales bacterium]